MTRYALHWPSGGAAKKLAGVLAHGSSKPLSDAH